jgi:hypothetical protein
MDPSEHSVNLCRQEQKSPGVTTRVGKVDHHHQIFDMIYFKGGRGVKVQPLRDCNSI